MGLHSKNNIFASIFFSRGMVVFLFVLIIFISLGLVSIIGKSIDASKNRKMAETESRRLFEKHGELTDKINSLETLEGQERALREQYFVVKEGEKVVVISDERENSTIEKIEPVEDNKEYSFWNFVKNLFKGKE